MALAIEPVGYVSCTRTQPIDDDWDREEASIRLVPAFAADSLLGLTEFSHVEVVYVFHQAQGGTMTSSRHPRGNHRWPLTGIFAQRAKNRPNRLGTTMCRLIGVEGTVIRVTGLDAIDGTPVVDIKPVMSEFLPRGEIVQPEWSRELMRSYWK